MRNFLSQDLIRRMNKEKFMKKCSELSRKASFGTTLVSSWKNLMVKWFLFNSLHDFFWLKWMQYYYQIPFIEDFVIYFWTYYKYYNNYVQQCKSCKRLKLLSNSELYWYESQKNDFFSRQRSSFIVTGYTTAKNCD